MNTPMKTQKELESLLTPDDLLEKPDDPDLEPDPTGLTPDWAREKKGAAEEDELPTKVKTPSEKTLEDLKGIKVSLAEWAMKRDDLFEEEKKMLEEETADIKKSFRKVAADDLTPDNLK